jgi:hypothetical protein
MFIIYCDPSETFEPITEWNFGGENQPENLLVQADDDYLRNPNPTNEHVGVDEETLYLQNEPVNALTVVGCFDRGKEKVVDDDEDVVEGDSESDLECDLDLENDSKDVEPEQGYEEINHHPIIDYDEEDPPMKPCSTYPNMAKFKLALCQHAIKRQFEFNTEKSSKHRFRGYCSRKILDNCPWKIHASTTADKVIVVVSIGDLIMLLSWFFIFFLVCVTDDVYFCRLRRTSLSMIALAVEGKRRLRMQPNIRYAER